MLAPSINSLERFWQTARDTVLARWLVMEQGRRRRASTAVEIPGRS